MKHEARSLKLEATEEVSGIRANMYRFLASSFLEPPTEGTIDLIRDSDYLAQLGDMVSSEAYRHFSNFVERKEFEELKIEFDNLFRIPMGQFVTPYESVYCDGREVAGESVRGLLMGPSVLEVKRLYAKGGMAISPKCPYLPDYVGVELSFMAHLCEGEEEALARGSDDEAQAFRDLGRTFFKEHIQRWVPDMCRRMAEKTTHDFFLGLAAVTRDFVEMERRYHDS